MTNWQKRSSVWSSGWSTGSRTTPPEFIADLKALIGTAKAAVRVAEMLENAERIMLTCQDDEQESYAVPSQDVDGAIEILLGGGDE